METPPKWLVTGYIALFALLPWSVELGFGTWNLSLPSEALIGFLFVGLAYSFWQAPQAFKTVFSNNFFIQISLVYLAWMAASACFSSLPIVSWKYWLVTVGHWWVFALGISVWPNLWRRAFPWFFFSMAGVACYALVHHAFYHFRADQAMLAPMPFFPDHTMWAAAIAMVMLHGGMAFRPSGTALFTTHHSENKGVNARYPDGLKAIPPLLFLSAALVFSSCRAAWVSVLLAGLVWSFLSFGRKMRLTLILALLTAGILFEGKMVGMLKQDVSSLERINRWHCAFRMAETKPLFGFGLGTFQFQYLDFQRSEDMTRISLHRPSTEHGMDTYGRGGGAHSEYLRVLAETGWLGLLLWLGLVAVVFKQVSFRILASTPKKPQNWNAPCWWPALALLTFLAHGLVNDFLHDGRMAALVWGSMALLFAGADEK